MGGIVKSCMRYQRLRALPTISTALFPWLLEGQCSSRPTREQELLALPAVKKDDVESGELFVSVRLHGTTALLVRDPSTRCLAFQDVKCLCSVSRAEYLRTMQVPIAAGYTLPPQPRLEGLETKTCAHKVMQFSTELTRNATLGASASSTWTSPMLSILFISQNSSFVCPPPIELDKRASVVRQQFFHARRSQM